MGHVPSLKEWVPPENHWVIESICGLSVKLLLNWILQVPTEIVKDSYILVWTSQQILALHSSYGIKTIGY